nr:hypothetical protein [Pseudomonas viridiflava]
MLVANIVNLAPGVSPARSLLNSACRIHLSKTGIAVSLQDPTKALEMNARMAGPALPVDASTPELARDRVARLRRTLRGPSVATTPATPATLASRCNAGCGAG